MICLSHVLACCFVIVQWKGGDSFRPLHQVRYKSLQSPSLSSLQSSSSNDDANEKSINNDMLSEATLANEGVSSRRMFFASSLVGAGLSLGGGRPEMALAQTNMPSKSNVEFLWEKNPVNPKRSSFRVTDAEKRYNLSFVTYLSRFLLSFDPIAQQWWMDRAKEIPKSASKGEIFNIREVQFARFSASVEVGLQEDDFVGKDGPRRLLESLLNQFGAPSTDTPSEDDSDRFTQETKESRRQLALLFGLLKDSQPTKEITMLLASIDNGTIETVILSEDARSAGLLGGFSPEDMPILEFPQPEAGSDYNQAIGKAVLKPTGKLLQIEIIEGGEGYTEAPDISKALPEVLPDGEPAITNTKIVNGVLKNIQLTNFGSGYNQESVIELKLKPHSGVGKSAIIRIIPEMEIAKIEMDDVGSGYAVERPLKINLVPVAGGEPQSIGMAYPKGQMGSFIAARDPGENKIRNFERALIKDEDKIISGASSGGNLPSAPFPAKASSSQQLLALLPQGFGLEYDAQKKFYILSVDKEYQKLYPSMTLQAPNRPLVPDFGPRGRNPIERTQKIDISTFLRFSLSGAICASGVHLALTPLDVVKTKVQIDPDRYPKILPAFQSVWKEEGPSTFFTGWLPTVCGHFFAGGVLFATTEVIRRSLTDAAGANAMSLEVPIILAAATIASGTAAVLYCPFDAVRIRSVSQPSYGANAIEIASRMVKEEGIEVLTDAIPVFVAKQVPYAAVKFTIFDLTTEYLYQTYPLAQEDLKLSLGISLIGGVLAGIAAATVSNPADAVISELKKAKSDQSPQEAFQALLDRGGVQALFKGLSIRMVLYSLTAAFQFLVYDGVRFALGVGPDDLRLYLNVLGEALNTNA
jgi:solute carrier family 25 phosphate transporter 3